MRSFSVYVEFDETEATPDTYEVLLDGLLDKHGAVGPASSGNLSCRISVDADSVIQAAALGIEYAQAAALRCGISPATVIGTEVVIEEELDRRLIQEDEDVLESADSP